MSATFNPDHICFFDFETKSGVDLQDAGAVRYACDPKAAAIILTYTIGRRPVELVVADAPGEPLVWDELPDDFRQFYDQARGSNTHKFAAHNAGFDRSIWNYALINAPELYPEMVIDTSVQATAAGLPPDLAGACQASGSIHKVEDGKKLIGLFCEPKSVGTPQTHPIQWLQFCNYAIGDIDAMRSLFLRTRQLPLREWQEYWAMEQINDRGIGIDRKFARKANSFANDAKWRSNEELQELTGGAVATVGQVKPLTQWLIGRLPADGDGMKILTKREEEVDEYGTETRPAKYSLTRSRVEKLIPYCESIKDADAVRALQIRLYGGSTTPAKYKKILTQQVGDTVYGQYVFNGAPQTGRASSRGVQIQNLSRSFLPYEHDAIEAILNGANYNQFAALGDDTPVVRKLALLIRPTFVPKGTNQFVVSDFSQIEARVLPWLVGPQSEGALARLQIFRDIDNDPSLPDLYTRSAAAMSGLAVTKITKALRQRGKVAELALGFGGGVGALAAMGANYGMYLPESEAKEVVTQWRTANPWCVRFWGKHDADASYGLWGAVNKALEQPRTEFQAGRVTYVYLKDVLGGTLYCQLPSGRCLAYRGIKYERVNILDDDDKLVDVQTQLRFWKGRTRSHIWHGTLCIAEGTPVLTERGWWPIESITTERVWDGDAWVAHGGVVCNGVRDVIELDGAWMTPDHQVLTTEGWADANSVGLNRAKVRLPDGYPISEPRQGAEVVGPLWLWRRKNYADEASDMPRHLFMRLHVSNPEIDIAAGETEAEFTNSRHVETSGVSCVAFNARSMSTANTPGMAQLRSTRHHSVRGMGKLRAFLGGHGAYISIGAGHRSEGQQRSLHIRELSLDDAQDELKEQAQQPFHRHAMGFDDTRRSVRAQRHWSKHNTIPTERRCARVYDILNAGPKNRFVIAGLTAPTIVHNCENIVQATAADLLRGTLVRCEDANFNVRLHSHDEILTEVGLWDGKLEAGLLRDVMRQGFDWSEGLPLMSEETIQPYYSKFESE